MSKKGIIMHCVFGTGRSSVDGTICITDLDGFIHAKGHDDVWFYEDASGSLGPVVVKKLSLSGFRISDDD